MRKTLKLITIVGLIIGFVAFGLPFLHSLYPKKFNDTIEEKDIESSALFYTESQSALEANFLLQKLNLE